MSYTHKLLERDAQEAHRCSRVEGRDKRAFTKWGYQHAL